MSDEQPGQPRVRGPHGQQQGRVGEGILHLGLGARFQEQSDRVQLVSLRFPAQNRAVHGCQQRGGAVADLEAQVWFAAEKEAHGLDMPFLGRLIERRVAPALRAVHFIARVDQDFQDVHGASLCGDGGQRVAAHAAVLVVAVGGGQGIFDLRGGAGPERSFQGGDRRHHRALAFLGRGRPAQQSQQEDEGRHGGSYSPFRKARSPSPHSWGVWERPNILRASKGTVSSR